MKAITLLKKTSKINSGSIACYYIQYTKTIMGITVVDRTVRILFSSQFQIILNSVCGCQKFALSVEKGGGGGSASSKYFTPKCRPHSATEYVTNLKLRNSFLYCISSLIKKTVCCRDRTAGPHTDAVGFGGFFLTGFPGFQSSFIFRVRRL